MRKIFIVINVDNFFLSHRRDIALAAVKKGYEVTLVTKDTGHRNEIEAMGVRFIDFPVNPTGMNLLQELKSFVFLWRLFLKEKPDVVHNVGLKNLLWGGLATKLAKIPCIINAVSGLGVMFSGKKLSLYARSILTVLRYSFNKNNVHVIFQNNDDKRLFLEHKVVKEEQCIFIKGSGVDLTEFSYTPETGNDKVNVIFMARMVKEKGVITLIEAAEKLKSEFYGKIEFWLCGGLSDNPLAIKKYELDTRCDGKYIKWLGHRNDTLALLKKSHIVAFPSYYREGVPKALIEASAIGRPIVTCDSIGCRDVVIDGVNGFLIAPKDSDALANRLKILADNKELRLAMGRKSREFAERDFSIDNVVNKHLELYAL